MNCQIMCPNRPESLTVVTRVSDSSTKKRWKTLMTFHIYLISILVVMSLGNSISQLAHTLQLNELDDVYWVDDSRNHTLPYELNIGKKLNHKLEGFELDFSVPERKF